MYSDMYMYAYVCIQNQSLSRGSIPAFAKNRFGFGHF